MPPCACICHPTTLAPLLQKQRPIGSSPGSSGWDALDGDDRLETAYQLRIRGTLLPEQVREMFHAIRFLQLDAIPTKLKEGRSVLER